MPTKQLFNEFADIPALQAEKQKVKEIFAEIKASIMELSDVGLKLDAAKSINQIATAQQKVVKIQQDVLLNEKKLEEAEARIAKLEADAAAKQEKADLTRTQNLILQNKEIDRQNSLLSKQQQVQQPKPAAEPRVQEFNQMTPARQSYVASVPFTSNYAELEKEIEAMQTLDTAITSEDEAYASLTNEANQFSTALKEQAIITSELGAEVDGVTLQYDKYTGSIAENLREQYILTTTIKENAAAQKELEAAIEGQSGGATARQTISLEKLRSEAALLIAENKELTATIKLQAQAAVAEEGSIAQLNAELSLLQKSLSKLNAEAAKSPMGQTLAADLKKTDQAVKAGEANMGKFSKNVGNYFGDITQAGEKLATFMTRDLFRAAAAFIVFQVAFTLIKKLGEGFIDILSPMKDFTDDYKAFTEIVKEQNDALEKNVQLIAENYRDAINRAKNDLSNAQAYGASQDVILDKQRQLNELQKQAAESNFTAEAAKQIQQLGLSGVTAADALAFAQMNYKQNYENINNQIVSLNGQLEKNTSLFIENSRVIEKERKKIEPGPQGLEALKSNIGIEDANKSLTKQIELLKVQRDVAKTSYDEVTTSIEGQANAQGKVADAGAAQFKFNAEERRKLTLAEAQDEYDIERTKNDIILNNDRSSFRQRLTALESNTNSEVVLLKKKQQVLDDQRAAGQITPVDYTIESQKLNTQIEISEKKGYEQRVKLIETYRLIFAKATTESENTLIKDDEEFQKKLIDNTIGSIETRKSALETFTKDQLNITRNSFELQLQDSGFSKKQADEFIETGKYQIKGKKITNEQLLAMQRQYESDVLKIVRDNAEQQTKILEEEIAKQTRLRQESVDRIELSYSKKSVSTLTDYTGDIIALNEANSKKLMSEEDYQKARRKIEVKYEKTTIDELINEIQDELTVYDDSNQKLIGAQVKLDRDRDRLRELEKSKNNEALIYRLEQEIAVDEAEVGSYSDAVKKKIALLEKLKKAQGQKSDVTNKDTTDTRKEQDQDALDLLGQASTTGNNLTNLSDAIHDKKIQQYEDQKKALEDRYNTEVDYINKVYANSVDKQQRLDEANKRYAASKAQLDQKEREEQLRKARFEKSNSIFQIIIGTAAAIIRDLGNPFKIVFDATMGAIQLAIAQAAPLPAYAKGTDSAPAGKALVGESGRELGIEPSGRVILWEKPTITNLIAGTKILPNRVTEDMMRVSNKYVSNSSTTTHKIEINNNRDHEIIEQLKDLNAKPVFNLRVERDLTTTAYYQNQLKR